MEARQRIIDTSRNLFKQHGIKAVSMDDIARQLKISKKTIYRYYSDKRSLVDQCFDVDLNHRKQACMAHCCQSEHAIQQFLDISAFVNRNLQDMNTDLIQDLHRFYPESWKKFADFHNTFIQQFLEDNIRLGIQQGYYREDLEPRLSARLFIQSLQYMIRTDLHRELNLNMGQTHQHVYTYHLYAICSPRGVDYLKQHIAA